MRRDARIRNMMPKPISVQIHLPPLREESGPYDRASDVLQEFLLS